MQIGKEEIKLSLFEDGMILFVKKNIKMQPKTIKNNKQIQ